MGNRNDKLNRSNPFPTPSLDEMMNEVVGNGTVHEPEVVYVDREVVVEVEVEKHIEVVRPVREDEHGITFTGNIGIDQVGLVFSDDVTNAEWHDFFNVIKSIKTSLQFIVGDWFLYGQEHFGHTSEQIAAWSGYSKSTVEHFASVCKSVTRLTRVNTLSFGHHRAVAKLDSDLQFGWLQYAIKNKLSARQLAAEIDGHRLESGEKETRKPIKLIDRSQIKRARKLPMERRKKYIEELRALADELEQG